MSFLKVLTEIDGDYINLPARITETLTDGTIKIQYLSQTEKRDPATSKKIWSYEDIIYEITDESISEYMYNEEDMGFIAVTEDDYIKTDISGDDYDSDYEPSTIESSSGEDEDEDCEDDEEPCEDYDSDC